jgi:hypothetical protein
LVDLGEEGRDGVASICVAALGSLMLVFVRARCGYLGPLSLRLLSLAATAPVFERRVMSRPQ